MRKVGVSGTVVNILDLSEDMSAWRIAGMNAN